MTDRLSARGASARAILVYFAAAMAIAMTAFFLLAVAARPAHAQLQCIPFEAAQARAAGFVAHYGGHAHHLDATQLALYADVIHQEIPDVDLSGDEAVAVDIPGFAGSLAISKGGTACGGYAIRPDLHKRALKAALGVPA